MSNRYQIVLSQYEILQLLSKGVYSVDSVTAEVRGPYGVVTPYVDKYKRHWIRLYHEGKRKGISRGRLVWMSITKRTIPAKFEIHHVDKNPANDTWKNLLCIHKLDHDKFNEEEPLPF